MSQTLVQKLRQPRRPLYIRQMLGGRYRVVEAIAQSGFGAVYKAKDTLFDRFVALKIALELEDEWDENELLFEEARQLFGLHHPGIPGYVDFLYADGQWVLVQQFIAGGHIRMDAPLSTRQVVFVGRKLCDILMYLREQDVPIIHRDIKPPNMLLAGEKLYLIDFGLSCHPGPNTFLCGSPGFAAPEQLDEQASLTPQVDVYGMGQTLLCLLTGQTPAGIADLATQRCASSPILTSNQPALASAPGYGKLLALFTAMIATSPEARPEIGVVKEKLAAIHRSMGYSSRSERA